MESKQVGILAKPDIGDRKKISYSWYQWLPCSSCGKGRWVKLIRGQPRNKLCVHCVDRSKQVVAMRLANLGTPRTQVTRNNISHSHKLRPRMYPLPKHNPKVGDLAKVGNHSCVWANCPICGRERWVRTKRGGLSIHQTCNSCVTEEKRQKLSIRETGRKHSLERIKRNRLAHLGQVVTEEVKEKIRQLWQNPVWANRVIRRQRQYISPNKPEQFLIRLLGELYPGKWKFVGDGKLVIASLNPDFWNGDHKLIEMWGDYWHKGQDPQERIDIFRRYGYQTLVIWERELKNTNALSRIIKEFSE